VADLREPAIVAYGRSAMPEYADSAFLDALRRAFVWNAADFITLDSNSRGQRFLAAGVAWALDNGLIFHDRTGSDGQSEVSAFRLTDAGKERLRG
jgi:hypothetical protein